MIFGSIKGFKNDTKIEHPLTEQSDICLKMILNLLHYNAKTIIYGANIIVYSGSYINRIYTIINVWILS